jgi:hypothetical protein
MCEPGVIYPRLIEATGRCPPEDIGGPRGYAEVLAAIDDPKHERHAESGDWIGDDFDPKVASADARSQEVEELAKRWSRKTSSKKTRAS